MSQDLLTEIMGKVSERHPAVACVVQSPSRAKHPAGPFPVLERPIGLPFAPWTNTASNSVQLLEATAFKCLLPQIPQKGTHQPTSAASSLGN